MRSKIAKTVLIILLGLLAANPAHAQKVKVFILAGQSNMEGHGQLRSLDTLGKHPEYGHLLNQLKDENGAWASRDDVTISWDIEDKGAGPLSVGWGYGPHEIGPEFMFGTIMGDTYDEHVLLIKTAWGGKDVYCDFRSPSAGKPTDDAAKILKQERAEGHNREVGFYFREMLNDINNTLAKIDEVVPNYTGQGYEIAGFAWFQGWNDFVQWHSAPGVIDDYASNLANMFRDLRKALGLPELPIAIGEMGVGGHKMAERAKNEDDREANGMMAFRAAQRKVAEGEGLDNVTFVPTADYWDARLQTLREMSDAYWGEKKEKGIPDTEENHLPTKELNDEYLARGGHWYAHYNGSATNYSLVGYALAQALLGPDELANTTPKKGLHPHYNYDPVQLQLEGWTLAVDPRLLLPEHEQTREKAFTALANHLQRVKYVVPVSRVEQLQELPIWIELDNPLLNSMQYHPGRDWLSENGHDPRLVKYVHIPHAKELYQTFMWNKHPYVVLHELTHAYHDQRLSFDNPEIMSAYEKAKESGTYEKVLLHTGDEVRHYGMNNQMEYFAEATEAYFGVNDFYPFVRAELERHDPAGFAIMEKYWGEGELSVPREDTELAMTPPMGWNSWNAFEVNINEEKIMEIADAMVSSGMRDAGYEYLVIDDGWMAKERDGAGRLVADPDKFPNGMKTVGDYIHDKGLKFGLYEDRGAMTCQQLPGSFEHEKIDMESFASWGVDYIKMDSCFAENNGRTSPDDYGLYRKYIEATGRAMVLSISDFGNAAWAWGGKESSQLWRTSYDIYPWMDSVYYCAETTAGDEVTHPAFNGLWQFAGPGHWNDPDMLQVGNFEGMNADEAEIANRAHLSLWAILAAPLMAGNDLRSIHESTVDVLTASEVIAVNQDPRGLQGYKVLKDGNLEVYNKPLADGTTALLFLNKGEEPANITISWDAIGLSASQPVRDIWAQEDLGEFQDSCTAFRLEQHGHRLLKVGRLGTPLPAPQPVPVEKYTVMHEGVTGLTDLYYLWKKGDPPVYDARFDGGPLVLDGKEIAHGLSVKSHSDQMFYLHGRGHRFLATVAVTSATPDLEPSRFRVFSGDAFSNTLLWESEEMLKGSSPRSIDIDVTGVDNLRLSFEGNDNTGIWALPRIIVNVPTSTQQE